MKLQINESQNIEFKQIWKDEYLKTICAFANTDGGKLYIGVDDDGNIIGIEDTILLVETLPNKINNRLGIIADVMVKSSENKSYIEIAVQKTFAPISYGGRFYQRSGSNTIELNSSNLTNFLLKRFGKTWDDVIEERFSIEEINLETIKKFKRLAKDRVPDIENENNLEELLRKLNLYDGEHLKRAAVLLFGKNSQKYYIQSHSKIGRFLSETDIQSSEIIDGNLIDQVDTIMDVLRLKYLKAYISYEGVHRREKLEYPYEALREAVINALIHRDYTNTTNLQIRVYDDKLVMYNGATLSEEVPVERFSQPHQSKPYNPTMAMVFYKCGFIENWGKGTLNMIEECLKYGLQKPSFEYEWNSLKITFYSNKKVIDEINGGLGGTINGGLSGTKKEIYDYIKSHEGTSAVNIENKLNIPLRTLQRWLKELKEKNFIEYRGSKKSGGYFIKPMGVKL